VQSLNHTSQLLKEYPFVLSHDAASGYLNDSERLVKEVIVLYSKTQSVGMSDQMDCGVRSFDYRPYVDKDGTVIAHHGSTLVPHLMSDTISEIIDWYNRTGSDELTLLYISHIEGKSCEDCTTPVMEVLQQSNIQYITDCSTINQLTYQAAQSMGKIDNSTGSLLAVFDCMDENYDPSITCYGYSHKTKYTCYEDVEAEGADSAHTAVPWQHFDSYMKVYTSPPTEPSANLFMTQAHWQSSTVSVPMGLIHRSSVLLDESRSSMNKRLVDSITSEDGQFGEYVNFLEVDNVCDHGLDIYQALQERFKKKTAARGRQFREE
jgi:hypothetical protein